jgi:excisionase family DNA binding protein
MVLRPEETGNEKMEQSNILAVSVQEAARRLSVSERTVASLVSRKELPSRKIGRRRVICVADLERFLLRDHDTREKPTHTSTGSPAPTGLTESGTDEHRK